MTVFTFARKLLENRQKGKYMRNIICLFILTSSSLFAGEILKWVDEDGNIYYGDSPPLAVETEQVRVISGPSDPGRALPRFSSSESQTSGSNSGTSTGDNQNNTTLSEDQAKISCQYAQEDLDVINRSTRIKLKSADGTTRYMSEEEIQARKENAEIEVDRYCQ